MPDLTITAVRPTSTTQIRIVDYGATVAAGEVLYYDTTDEEWKLADCDAASEETAKAKCMAMTPGVDGGQGVAAFGGDVILVGASMVGGDSQVLSGTAGKIQQDVDFASSDYITGIGRALDATTLRLDFDPTGEQVA